MDIKVDDYKLLNLNKDPFSTAPDPEFLYQSRQHFGTLQLLECSIKKEKGMSVVLGSPGTGKTTICRQLHRKVSFKESITAQVLYAHYFENSEQLIREIADLFGFVDFKKSDDIFDLLAHSYQNNGKTMALIVDNGHMIPEFCLSVLNRLSDLKTNGKNFFKIVIFANKEFSTNIKANPDFKSRIINYRILGPFNFRDTRQMIIYRLKMAGSNLSVAQVSKTKKIFSYPAMLAIYLATGGYPRKIVVLCHRCIVSMLLKNTIRANWFLVRSNAKRVLTGRNVLPESAIATSLIIIPLLLVVFTIGIMNNDDFTSYIKAVNHVVGKLSVNQNTTHLKDANTENNQVEIVDDGEILILPKLIINEESNDNKLNKELDEKENLISEQITIEKTKNNDSLPDQKQSVENIKNKDLKADIPSNLGTVEVKRSDTLLAMLELVYGHSRTKYKNPVVEANQHISNINSLDIGDMINFPTIIVDVKNEGREKIWVKIKSADNLKDAVNYIRKWSVKDFKLKIIPYYAADTGLNFDIVHKKLYKDIEEASSFIKNLPPEITDVPVIIEFPFNKIVLFANPYAM